MKKILLLVAVAAGALFVVKKRKSSKLEADLWAEATTEPGTNP